MRSPSIRPVPPSPMMRRRARRTRVPRDRAPAPRRRRRMMVLEMGRPLNYLSAQVLHFFQPFVAVLGDAADTSSSRVSGAARIARLHRRAHRGASRPNAQPAATPMTRTDPNERPRHPRHRLRQHDHQGDPDREGRRRLPADASRRSADDRRGAVRRRHRSACSTRSPKCRSWPAAGSIDDDGPDHPPGDRATKAATSTSPPRAPAAACR